MSPSLEELKQQRAQIQKHLDWLDAKIEAFDSDGLLNETTSPIPSQEPTEEPSQASEPKTGSKNIASVEHELTNEHSVYKAHTRSDLKRAKIGCLVFFCIAIAIFLFLLFGLPYLW